MILLQVSHSLLVCDLLRKLIERFQEKDIELILLVLKSKYLFTVLYKHYNCFEGVHENKMVRIVYTSFDRSELKESYSTIAIQLQIIWWKKPILNQYFSMI